METKEFNSCGIKYEIIVEIGQHTVSYDIYKLGIKDGNGVFNKNKDNKVKSDEFLKNDKKVQGKNPKEILEIFKNDFDRENSVKDEYSETD